MVQPSSEGSATQPDVTTIGALIARELASVRLELEAYPDEAAIWTLPPGLPNSGGTLALHIAGNLRHFIGKVLGASGYVRDRDREFAARDVPRRELLEEVAAAEREVRAALSQVTAADLDREYPEPIRDFHVQTGEFLLHLAVHLGYHLGQLSYHRRVVTGDVRGVGALSPGGLPSAGASPQPAANHADLP